MRHIMTTSYERLLYFSIAFLKAEKRHKKLGTRPTADAVRKAKAQFRSEVIKQSQIDLFQ